MHRYGKGQCWQVDPKGERPPQITKLGGIAGGNYEAVGVDDRRKRQPIFFVSEDSAYGALRRYTPPPLSEAVINEPAGWDRIHKDGGTTSFLFFRD